MNNTERTRDNEAQRQAAESKNHATDMPTIINCLFEEHRYLAALARVLASKAGQRRPLEIGDYYLLRDIAGYLSDYPDQVHHPTEDLLFEKLERRRPSMKKAIQRLRADHDAVLMETGELLGLLDRAIDKRGQGCETTLRDVCASFARHQQEHMEFENRTLFPAALKSLRPTDWRDIESQFAAVEDPLFGRVVGNKHRRLYEYMISPQNDAFEKHIASRIVSLERLIGTSDVIVKGLDAGRDRVRKLGEGLSEESRTTVKQFLQSPNLTLAIVLPFSYGAFLGSSLMLCAYDLLDICSSTVSDAFAHCSQRPTRIVDPQ